MTKNRHPISQAPLPERTRPFWLEVRWYIETIWALFQGPEAIAACYAMARKEYNVLASWLRQAEAFARRVLLADALMARDTYRFARKKDTCPSKTSKKTARNETTFDPYDPQSWRAPFRLTEKEKEDTQLSAPAPYVHPSERSARKLYKQVRFPDCRNLARRFEALCRVWDAPELYVKRLARLIRKAPKWVHELLEPIAFNTSMDPMFEALRQLIEASTTPALNTS